MNQLLKDNEFSINELCSQHHVKKLYAFGSVMRNDFNEESDIDFLYEFDTAGIDFDDLDNAEYDYSDNLFLLKEKLEILLKRKVDLLPNVEIKNKFLQAAIEQDKTLIYGSEKFAEIFV